MLILNFGYTFWNPIIWIIALIIVIAIAYFFRSRGVKAYKEGTAQAKIFLSGEEVPEAEQRHVRGDNVYWGFFETLKGYYSGIIKPHTGIINDFVIWLVIIMAISTIVILIVG